MVSIVGLFTYNAVAVILQRQQEGRTSPNRSTRTSAVATLAAIAMYRLANFG